MQVYDELELGWDAMAPEISAIGVELMVQANPALQKVVAVMRRTGWLDADSRPSAYAIEQLVSIADRCHAQSGQEPAVESPRRRKLTHGQYDMRHAVDPDRGLSTCHGHP